MRDITCILARSQSGSYFHRVRIRPRPGNMMVDMPSSGCVPAPMFRHFSHAIRLLPTILRTGAFATRIQALEEVYEW